MENYPFAHIEEIRDPFAVERYEQAQKCGEDARKVLEYLKQRGRDNSRTPMQWDPGLYAGFSTAVPWINVNPNYTEINAQQINEPGSIINFYRDMIRLRKESEYSRTLVYGGFKEVGTKEENLIGYIRHDGQYNILVLVNFGTEMITVPDDLRDGKIILNNRTETDGILHPYQAIVRVRENYGKGF